MGSHIIKPLAEEDFYVVYSTVVDAPVDWGTREELSESINDPIGTDRLERADRLGTSARWGIPLVGGWGELKICVREGFREDDRKDMMAWVARDNLRAFCENMDDDGYWNTDYVEWEPWNA